MRDQQRIAEEIATESKARSAAGLVTAAAEAARMRN
jgi:hypothetical protein